MDAEEPTDEAEVAGGTGDPAVEQLQRAAQQMVDASRVVLDAFEKVISDRERLGEIVTSFTDLLDRVGRTFSEFRQEPSGGADAGSGGRTGEAPEPARVRRIELDD